jgi:hypothetical protein
MSLGIAIYTADFSGAEIAVLGVGKSPTTF